MPSLAVAAAHATRTGPRPRNEDFVGMVTPHEPELTSKGLIAAIADGVSGNEGGREAAEYSVRGLLADYYAAPETWPVTQALDRVIKAINSWVQQQGSVRPELAGMASTLTALVLRGRSYYFSHAGDSRLYLLRGGALSRLTTDHVWDRPEMQHVLIRAVGLDSRIAIDHGMGELLAGDVFLLATDGVWAALNEFNLTALLAEFAAGRADAERAADALVNAALAAGSADNASVLVLKVAALPEENLRDALSTSRQLPLPPKLKPGQSIDGYLVEAVIHESQSSMLYRVFDPQSKRKLAMKTLPPGRGYDEEERSTFAREEWLAKRTVSRFFAQVITPAQRNWLYYLTTWHDGHTLQDSLDAGIHFTVPEAAAHGIRLARAVGALHRRSILHRDIKPANIHLGDDGELRVLDFGVAQSGLEAEEETGGGREGTPSFLAPERFDHAPASHQTDLYAAGVTLYHLLTRRYPYGEIEPFQKPRFNDPVPPTRYRPDIPTWLENVLLKAVARDPSDRFETAEELLLALERGPANRLARQSPMPLVKRDPAALWRSIALIAIVFNLLLLYLLAAR